MKKSKPRAIRERFGSFCAVFGSVKKAVTKGGRSKAGFIRSTISPVHDDHDSRFGLVDVMMIVALIGGTIAIARFFLAH